MVYGGNLEAEQEVIVRLDRVDGQAHICSTWPAWSRKLERLFGSPRKVTERDGKVTSAFWTVPRASVRVRRLTKRPMSLEAKKAVGDRLKQARLARQALQK